MRQDRPTGAQAKAKQNKEMPEVTLARSCDFDDLRRRAKRSGRRSRGETYGGRTWQQDVKTEWVAEKVKKVGGGAR